MDQVSEEQESGRSNKSFYASMEILDPMSLDKKTSSPEVIMNVSSRRKKGSSSLQSESSSGHASHRVEWRDLQFVVRKKNVQFKPPLNFKLIPFEKEILQPQTGCIKSGEMTALMGPSGAGKTTLLNAITGKCDPNFVSGDINFVTTTQTSHGRHGYGHKKLLKLSYVPQKDFLHQDFTIRETLTFAYKFNCISSGQRLSGHEIKSKVEKLAMDINLTVALDTKVAACSGGQAKRVSVAIELISNPNILILDEPTTGLDSVNAQIIITVIKNLLTKRSNFDHNYTPPAVICAIHQPSIEVFNLFDQIYVLAEGGKNIFSGHPKQVPEMLSINDVVLTPNSNPADFLLMLCQSKKEIKTMTTPIEKFDDESITSIATAKKETDKSYKNVNFVSTVGLLLQRQIKMVQYNPWPIVIRSLFCIVSTVGMNSMYDHVIGSHSGCFEDMFGFDSGPSNLSLVERLGTSNFEGVYNDSLQNMSNVLDNVAFLLISMMFIVVVHCFMTLVEIPAEIKIISKEVSNHWYSINSYISSRIAVTFILIVFHISFFAWFMMWVTDQVLDWERYLLITAAWILLAWISELTGFTIGVFFHNDMISAVLIQVVCMFPLFLFSGFFVKPKSMPSFIKPITMASQMKHTFEVMMIVTYGRGRCTPADDGQLSFSQFLKLTPLKMIGRFMTSNNITHETSKMISPLLGMPDTTCFAQIINATRRVLGNETAIEVNLPVLLEMSKNSTSAPLDFVYDYDESFNLARTSKIVADVPFQAGGSISSSVTTKIEDLSLPLSMFGLSEGDLEQCYISLVVMLFIYVVLNFLVLRRIVKVNF